MGLPGPFHPRTSATIPVWSKPQDTLSGTRVPLPVGGPGVPQLGGGPWPGPDGHIPGEAGKIMGFMGYDRVMTLNNY